MGDFEDRLSQVRASVDEAIAIVRSGGMLIVVDEEDRENEGDLLMAAEKVRPEDVAFMATYGRGLICAPITQERAAELDLKPMVDVNTDPHGTAFTVSVDAAEGITTGISAHDRARTLRLLADPRARAADFRRPGHVFPLVARPGGVLRRAGHTEAAVDLAMLAGLYPAGVICEIMRDDGQMARLPDLVEFANRFGLKILTIEDLIAYRHRRDKLVRRVASVKLPTVHGDFLAIGYHFVLDPDPDRVHVALVKGEVEGKDGVLVRVHSECLTGDVFGSLRCDCGVQLSKAMEMIEKEGLGVLLYMRQEGRGIGLLHKLMAYELQEQGLDTVEANRALGFPDDLRNYGVGAQILSDLGLRRIRLITNNPRKIVGLQGYGLEVIERVPLEVEPNEHNLNYLRAKRDKMGHLLGCVDLGR